MPPLLSLTTWDTLEVRRNKIHVPISRGQPPCQPLETLVVDSSRLSVCNSLSWDTGIEVSFPSIVGFFPEAFYL